MILHPIPAPSQASAPPPLPGVCDLRLSLSAADALPAADLIEQATLHALPWCGNRVSLSDGTNWSLHSLPAEGLSFAAAGLTVDRPHDVFLHAAPALALDLLAWSDDATRATGLALHDGVWVKAGDVTRRYVGTVRTVDVAGSARFTDAVEQRYLWNAQHRRPRPLARLFPAGTVIWSYSASAWAPANNDSTMRVQLVRGLATEPVELHGMLLATEAPPGNNNMSSVGLGLDSTSVNHADLFGNHCGPSGYPWAASWARAMLQPAAGRHDVYLLHRSDNNPPHSWAGALIAGASQAWRGGISGSFWA